MRWHSSLPMRYRGYLVGSEFHRRAVVSLGSAAFGLLWFHKSEYPRVFGRYSLEYTVLLGLAGVNLGLLWYRVAHDLRCSALVSRVCLRSLLSVGAVLLSVIVLVDLVGLDRPLWRADWVIVALVVALVVQLEASSRRPLFMSARLGVAACALILAIALAEYLAARFVLEPMTPKTWREFHRLMSGGLIKTPWPEPISVAKPEGMFRILGLADSFGVAPGASGNYHYLLERELRQHVSPRIQMVNVSVPGYEPAHELGILVRFGMAYAPDLVLHGFFVGNDFDVTGDDFYSYGDIWARRRGSFVWYRPGDFLTRDWIRNALVVIRDRWQRQAEHRVGVAHAGSFSKGAFLEMQFHRLNRWARRKHADGMRQTFAVLDAIRSVVERGGARYVMVIHPDETQVNRRLAREILQTFGGDEKAYDLGLPNHLLLAYCVERRIDCVDLLTVFRAATAEDRPLYLLHDSHYNRDGNELVASTLARFLREKHLLPRSRERGDVGVSVAPGFEHGTNPSEP